MITTYSYIYDHNLLIMWKVIEDGGVARIDKCDRLVGSFILIYSRKHQLVDTQLQLRHKRLMIGLEGIANSGECEAERWSVCQALHQSVVA